jgi:hypothetical protein
MLLFNFGSVCFAVKCFPKNIFSIYECLFACKILVNLKLFSVDRKI